MIIKKKAKKKENLSKSIADTIVLAEVAWVSNPVNFARKYMWVMNNTNLDAAKKLGLTNIKKY